MSTSSDDQYLDRYLSGGSGLSQAYGELRDASPELPPMHLDARVLGAARQSVAPEPLAPLSKRSSFSRHWALPVSLAAIVVLSVSLVVVVQPTSETADQQILTVPSDRTDGTPLDPRPGSRAAQPAASRPQPVIRAPTPSAADQARPQKRGISGLNRSLSSDTAKGRVKSTVKRPGNRINSRSLRAPAASATTGAALENETDAAAEPKDQVTGSPSAPLNRAIIAAERARQQAESRREEADAAREVTQRKQEAEAINAARAAREQAARQALQQTERAERARDEARRRLTEDQAVSGTLETPADLSETTASGTVSPPSPAPAKPAAAISAPAPSVPAAPTPARDARTDRAYELGLEIIRDHIDRGRLEAARSALNQLKQRFPDRAIPADIAAALAR